jgi:hypothetical protein
MKFIQTLLKQIVIKEKKVLGRWTVENCDKRINRKIELSNEDHCGPCGQYMLEKTIPYKQVKT